MCFTAAAKVHIGKRQEKRKGFIGSVRRKAIALSDTLGKKIEGIGQFSEMFKTFNCCISSTQVRLTTIFRNLMSDGGVGG